MLGRSCQTALASRLTGFETIRGAHPLARAMKQKCLRARPEASAAGLTVARHTRSSMFST
ncbi:MAG: hypothetical protein ACI841_003114 [Planctomycetota bacterium]|jgi:hypothetical protein